MKSEVTYFNGWKGFLNLTRATGQGPHAGRAGLKCSSDAGGVLQYGLWFRTFSYTKLAHKSTKFIRGALKVKM